MKEVQKDTNHPAYLVAAVDVDEEQPEEDGHLLPYPQAVKGHNRQLALKQVHEHRFGQRGERSYQSCGHLGRRVVLGTGTCLG